MTKRNYPSVKGSPGKTIPLKKQMIRLRSVLPALVLALLTAAVFLPIVNHDFVGYDDDELIVKNEHMRSGLSRWLGQRRFGTSSQPSLCC